ncbi:MAG TPA: hypothetical protein VIW78_00870 [Burkholderiales bacterium]
MAKLDAAVWTRFLNASGTDFLSFCYDVALGGRRIEGLDLSVEEQLGWQYNTALKIDAVGLTEDQAWIIEVRPSATVSAVGSALCYTLVCEREQVFDRQLIPVICCETIQPDVAWVCQRLGVSVVRV